MAGLQSPCCQYNEDAVEIRAVAVDDHPLLREGIAALIADETDIALVGEAADGCEVLEQFRRLRPDCPHRVRVGTEISDLIRPNA